MIKQNGKREEGEGWTSAYSILSVLTQLQSFLFEENLTQNKETVELNTKKAVKEANLFKCKECKHGGKLSCWPAFSAKETMLQ
jgi:ubiquitin-protein ligase